MNNEKNLPKPLNEIDPEAEFNFCYIKGVGDLITWFLHRSPFKYVTKNILQINSPCNQCSQRRQLYNILLPLPLWKFFFKTESEMDESFLRTIGKLEIHQNLSTISEESSPVENKVESDCNGECDGSCNAKNNVHIVPTTVKKDRVLVGESSTQTGSFEIIISIYKINEQR